MRRIYVLLSLLLLLSLRAANGYDSQYSDFEEFDDESESSTGAPRSTILSTPPITAKLEVNHSIKSEDIEDVEVEDEPEEEIHHYTKPATPQLKINQVPIHFKSNWDSYYIEMILLSGLAIYLVVFITGHSKNSKIANEWYHAHKDIFESNFLLIGDDNKVKNLIVNNETSNNLPNEKIEDDSTIPEQTPVLAKDSENIYLLWCSGRVGCEGMLVEIKLLKRQDLFSLIASYFKHDTDKIIVTVYMNNEDMDSYILAVGQKKYIGSLVKDMKDLNLYCPEKKSGEKIGLPPNFQFLSEIGEATLSLIDSKVIATCNKYPDYIDWIHFSDQYAGKKSPDEGSQTVKPEDSKKCLRFGFSVPSNKWNSQEDLATLRPLLLFVFYCIDKVHRFRLGKEAKQKSFKNRMKVEETFYRQQHSQRQEAAQVRREEKRKAEKDRVLNEEDPLKQKKLEDKEYKRELKKRNPKFKQVKIRAM